MSKNVYKLDPLPPQNLHYISYNCLHFSAGAFYPHLMGCPGGQGYTHDLARLIDFAISDSTSTVLSTLITKTTHLQGRWSVSFFLKRLKMYGMWMGRAGQSNSLCGTKTDIDEVCVWSLVVVRWNRKGRNMWPNAAVGNESETSDLSTSLEEFIAAIQCFVLWGVMIFMCMYVYYISSAHTYAHILHYYILYYNIIYIIFP